MKQQMERLYIIRWSNAIRFPSGKVSNMLVTHGDRKAVEEYARQIAKENNVSVEIID